MAVYTHLTADDLAGLIAEYDVGELVSAKGIAEGVSNSNWLVETTGGRFILTMYEHRVDAADLPFFLGLLDHLSVEGQPGAADDPRPRGRRVPHDPRQSRRADRVPSRCLDRHAAPRAGARGRRSAGGNSPGCRRFRARAGEHDGPRRVAQAAGRLRRAARRDRPRACPISSPASWRSSRPTGRAGYRAR